VRSLVSPSQVFTKSPKFFLCGFCSQELLHMQYTTCVCNYNKENPFILSVIEFNTKYEHYYTVFVKAYKLFSYVSCWFVTDRCIIYVELGWIHDCLTAIFQVYNIPPVLNTKITGDCEFEWACKEPMLTILRRWPIRSMHRRFSDFFKPLLRLSNALNLRPDRCRNASYADKTSWVCWLYSAYRHVMKECVQNSAAPG
jgi:hypothetical protein